jgi:hypothetical protein
MPRRARAAGPDTVPEEPEAQRPRADELPFEFDVVHGEEDVRIRSEHDDPWHVARKGVVIKPYGTWWGWDGPDGDKRYDCVLVGYTPSFTYVDGAVNAAYILENTYDGETYYYAMEPKNVWALLLVKDRPIVAEDSDDDDVDRAEIDDDDVGGARARRGRPPSAGARILPPNAPRLGDEWAEEISALVDKLHGTAEATEETARRECAFWHRGRPARVQPVARLTHASCRWLCGRRCRQFRLHRSHAVLRLDARSGARRAGGGRRRRDASDGGSSGQHAAGCS